jgi:hypothetical protein
MIANMHPIHHVCIFSIMHAYFLGTRLGRTWQQSDNALNTLCFGAGLTVMAAKKQAMPRHSG